MFRWFLLILTASTSICFSSQVNGDFSNHYANADDAISSVTIGQEQDELHEMLNTEQVLINTLRYFIESQEQKLDFLKSKTLEIRRIHDGATNREKYLYNPINAVTILKRFTADWNSLKSYAENFLNTEEFVKNCTQRFESLRFPTDDECDAALINLLRIQDMYQLEPQSLAVGEVNGVKLGSEMTWSDCLEIGLKSSKNGYQTYAKYWMETALEKLPTVSISNKNVNDTNNKQTTILATATTTYLDDYTVKARLEVMRALLNTEYKLGNLNDALKLANEILELQPKHQNVLKAKKKIEKELKKNNGLKIDNNNNNKSKGKNKGSKEKKTIKKSVEELMIEEICREANSLQTSNQIHSALNKLPTSIPACALVNNNLPFLLIQPVKAELLSLDPYIAIYHNIFSPSQMEKLKDFIKEQEENNYEFTKIGQKKLRKINAKLLQDMTGHYDQEIYDDWQVTRYNFENFMNLETVMTYESSRQAQIMFNLQSPILGGSVAFPQLELIVNLPKGSVLYWSLLNEFQTADYRSKHYMCPVIAGTQIINGGLVSQRFELDRVFKQITKLQ